MCVCARRSSDLVGDRSIGFVSVAKNLWVCAGGLGVFPVAPDETNFIGNTIASTDTEPLTYSCDRTITYVGDKIKLVSMNSC